MLTHQKVREFVRTLLRSNEMGGPFRERPLSPSQIQRAQWFLSKYPTVKPVTDKFIQQKAYMLNTTRPHEVANEILQDQGVLPR